MENDIWNEISSFLNQLRCENINRESYIYFQELANIQLKKKMEKEKVNKLLDHISNEDREKLKQYGEILEEHGIKWGQREMESVDVSDMDLQGVLALLMGMVRAERFCDGAIMGMLRSGAVLRWLQRIEKIVGMDVE